MLSRLVHALRFTSGARARAAAAILVLVLPSCSSSYPNPFENSSQMTPPPATAKIVFTANTYATQKGGGLDIFAMEDTGANVTRLTFCNTADRRCDYLEAIPGTAGIMVPPPGYLAGVRALCDEYGIVFVLDEVMAGFGRTGEWFAADLFGEHTRRQSAAQVRTHVDEVANLTEDAPACFLWRHKLLWGLSNRVEYKPLPDARMYAIDMAVKK